MWIRDEEMSKWAYNECLKGNDKESIRLLIKKQKLIMLYCKNIIDREEMYKRIKNPFWSFMYCWKVNNREVVRKYILLDSEACFWYCKLISDCEQMRKNVNVEKWTCHYCVEINNDPEVRKKIESTWWKNELVSGLTEKELYGNWHGRIELKDPEDCVCF